MSWAEFSRSDQQVHRRCMALIAEFADGAQQQRPAVPGRVDLLPAVAAGVGGGRPGGALFPVERRPEADPLDARRRPRGTTRDLSAGAVCCCAVAPSPAGPAPGQRRREVGAMRRWWTAVAAGAAAALALAGCGAPAGVDRDLADDWPALAAPQAFVPAAGACHAEGRRTSATSAATTRSTAPSRTGRRPCTWAPSTGPDAGAAAPPRAGSAGDARRPRRVRPGGSKAVGADWRSGRLGLPSSSRRAPAWSGGARWFRCDVTEIGQPRRPGASPPHRQPAGRAGRRLRRWRSAASTRSSVKDDIEAMKAGRLHRQAPRRVRRRVAGPGRSATPSSAARRAGPQGAAGR